MENSKLDMLEGEVNTQVRLINDSDIVSNGHNKGMPHRVANLIHNEFVRNHSYDFLDMEFQNMPRERSPRTNNFYFNGYRVSQDYYGNGPSIYADKTILSLPVMLRFFNVTLDVEIFVSLMMNMLNLEKSFDVPTIIKNSGDPIWCFTDDDFANYDREIINEEVLIQTTAQSESEITEMVTTYCQNYSIDKHYDNPDPSYNCVKLFGADAEAFRSILSGYLNFEACLINGEDTQNRWTDEKVENLGYAIKQKILSIHEKNEV